VSFDAHCLLEDFLPKLKVVLWVWVKQGSRLAKPLRRTINHCIRTLINRISLSSLANVVWTHAHAKHDSLIWQLMPAFKRVPN
jgi:hypothetical protein